MAILMRPNRAENSAFAGANCGGLQKKICNNKHTAWDLKSFV